MPGAETLSKMSWSLNPWNFLLVTATFCFEISLFLSVCQCVRNTSDEGLGLMNELYSDPLIVNNQLFEFALKSCLIVRNYHQPLVINNSYFCKSTDNENILSSLVSNNDINFHHKKVCDTSTMYIQYLSFTIFLYLYNCTILFTNIYIF